MLTILKSLYSTYGYRVIGTVVGLGVAKLAALGFALDSATQTSLVLAVYGVVHTVLDGKKAAEPAKQ